MAKNCSPSAISRRAFILSATALGGAMVVGLRLATKTVQPQAVELYNWIVIAPDNTVTIRIAQMEMGQGAMTAMAQLLAEELEADWTKIRTEFISIRTHLARKKVYGRTATAGSAGVYRSQKLLRIVGAQIRTMLIKAAARRFEVLESELIAENSIVTHVPTGRRLTYGELATDAANVTVPDPDSVKLKDPRDWKYIGRSIQRVDAAMKTDGTAVFGIDVRIPHMKYAAIAMSPVFGGKLNTYDPGAALQQPGVYRIVEIRDDRIGDAIAVVADGWWQAKKALEAIPLKWEGGRWAALDDSTILGNLRAGLEGPPDRILREEGNAEAAMASAAQILEAEYFVPYLEHATMEPMNCTALVTDENFEVWAPTQIPTVAFGSAASVAEMPIKRGNINLTQIGGGFGRRQESDFVTQAVHIAKAIKGVPVKLIWSREDTMRHGFYRPANLSRMRGALDADGNLIAWWHRIVAPSNDEDRNWLGSDTFLHAIPHIMVDFVVRDSPVREGQMRGVGYATHTFFIQSFMDELARAAGKDPYQFQRALLNPDKTPETVPTGTKGDFSYNMPARERARRLSRVLDEAALRSGWGSPLAPNRGRGIAAHQQAEAFYAVVVEVTLDGEGWLSTDRVVVAGDPGFLVNPDNAAAQVEGCVAFGLTSAMYGQITIREGRVMEGNFDDYQLLRIHEMPEVDIYWVPSQQREWGGIGEPVVASIIPALTNAIYDAGGPRIRSLPLKNHKILRRATE